MMPCPARVARRIAQLGRRTQPCLLPQLWVRPVPPARRLFRSIVARGLACAFALYAATGAALAQSGVDAVLEDIAETDEPQLLAVPVPIVDPTLGNGLAVAGIGTFPGGDGTDGPRSTLALVGAYTDTESWLAAAGGKLHLDDDRYRLSFAGGYALTNLDYFGRSEDSVFFDHPLPFSLRGWFANVEGQARIAEALYGGVQLRYLRPTVSLNTRFDRVNQVGIVTEFAGFGPTLAYDTRDWANEPSAGDHAYAELLSYHGSFVDFSTVTREFTAVDGFWRHYAAVADDLVLATELRGAWGSDETPFFLLPFVSFRGFPAGQYLGQSVLQGQGELRWRLDDRLGLVAFGGAGAAFPDGVGGGSAGHAWGGGLGARYQVSERDRLNVGLDLAYGSTDDAVVYFRVGEAF